MTKQENLRFWAAVVVSPAFPLTVLSLGMSIGSLAMLRDLCQLFALGACAGALFWVIAFWGVTPAAGAD